MDVADRDGSVVAAVAMSVDCGVRCYCFGNLVPGATDLRIDMSGERLYDEVKWFCI